MNDQQLLRYSRHLLLPQLDLAGQTALLASHALIIGAGGLGSPVAMYLASAGVGTLTVCDNDSVELTNLQRQIAHDMASLGRLKVDSVASRLAALNPDVRVQPRAQRRHPAALAAAVAQADVVLDCSDNFATRHAVNAACVAASKPLVSGAAVRFDGQLAVFDPRQPDAPFYHCLFPDHGDASDGPCATFGVFAPLVGIIGCMQAAEALKLLVGIRSNAVNRLAIYDGLSGDWRHMRLTRDPGCPVCGGNMATAAV